MNRWIGISMAAIMLAVPTYAQNGQAQVGNFGIRYVVLAPSGPCSPTSFIQVVTSDGIVYTCQGGTWGAIGGGASGGVASFAAGSLTPVFTTAVAAPDSDPVLTFVLSSAAAHTFLGNNTGSLAVPAYAQPGFTDLSGSIAPTQLPSTTFTWPGGGGLVVEPEFGIIDANDFVGGAFNGDCSACTGLQTSNLSGTVSRSNGGTGTSTAPSAGQILVAQTANLYTPVTLSGTCTITTTGVLTCAPPFSSLASGTNTGAAMLVGTGASLGTSGSGTIAATSVPASGLTGTTLATNVVNSSLTSVGTLANLTVTNAPVFTALTGYLYGNGAGAVTASTTIPFAALPSLSANTVLGALSATTASGLALPSCSSSTSALSWTTGTGFGCNTITPGTGTVTSVATTGPITGGTITATGTIGCASCVTASSPGVGIAHFAGSTQAVTSSAVSLTADVSGVLPAANGGSNANTSTATITVGAGAGTGGTAACVGGTTCTSARGRVTISSGATPSAGTVATATFGTSYATAPVCQVTMNGGTLFLIPGWSSTTGVLTISTGLAIGLSTTVELDYFCQL